MATVARGKRSKGMSIALWILRCLAALAFLPAGAAKLAGAAPMVAMFAKLGLGQWFRYVTGLVEVVAAIGVLIPRVSKYAALALVAVMIGAIVSHLTVLGGRPPILLFLIVAAIAWLGSGRE